MSHSSSPNLFLIGAPKCGTTTLFSMLTQLPDVACGKFKEPHFFCPDLQEMRRCDEVGTYLNWYSSHARYVVDASTNYVYSDACPSEIQTFNPDSRFILCVRDPVELVKSLHAHLVFRGLEPSSLEVAWDAGALRNRYSNTRTQLYPGHVDYKSVGALGSRLRHWLDQIDESRLEVVFLDDLKADATRVFKRVAEFLDLDVIEYPPVQQLNRRKPSTPSSIAQFLMYPPAPLRYLKPAVKVLTRVVGVRSPGQIYDWISRQSDRNAPGIELVDAIRCHYSKEVQLLGKLSGRDLTHWLPSTTAQRVAVK